MNNVMFSLQSVETIIVYRAHQSESAINTHTCILLWQIIMIYDYFKVLRILIKKTKRDEI